MNNQVPRTTIESNRIIPVRSDLSIKKGEEEDKKRLIL